MLRPRVIPCLLVRNRGLVKTVGFGEDKYVGDPINAVKIFNEKGVDELMVLDIDATTKGHEPDYRMIENLAAESRMPLCYGGGVKTAEQARTIIGLGVEKVALSSAAVANPALISQIAEAIGSQSVVVVLDVKARRSGGHEVWTHNGRVNSGRSPVEAARDAERLGVGEIVLNSIDNDGRGKGYDLDLVSQIREATSVPISFDPDVPPLPKLQVRVTLSSATTRGMTGTITCSREATADVSGFVQQPSGGWADGYTRASIDCGTTKAAWSINYQSRQGDIVAGPAHYEVYASGTDGLDYASASLSGNVKLTVSPTATPSR